MVVYLLPHPLLHCGPPEPFILESRHRTFPFFLFYLFKRLSVSRPIPKRPIHLSLHHGVRLLLRNLRC